MLLSMGDAASSNASTMSTAPSPPSPNSLRVVPAF
jgi:hypothetical protein